VQRIAQSYVINNTVKKNFCAVFRQRAEAGCSASFGPPYGLKLPGDPLGQQADKEAEPDLENGMIGDDEARCTNQPCREESDGEVEAGSIVVGKGEQEKEHELPIAIACMLILNQILQNQAPQIARKDPSRKWMAVSGISARFLKTFQVHQ